MATPEEIQRLQQAAERANEASIRASESLATLTQGTEAFTSAQMNLVAAEQAAAQAELELMEARNADVAVLQVLRAEVQQNTRVLEEYKRLLAESQKQQQDGAELAANLAGRIGLLTDAGIASNQTLQAFTAGGLKGLSQGFKEALNPVNMLTSLFATFIETSIELAMALDDTSVSLMQTTGMGREFEDNIRRLQGPLNDFAVFVPQIGEAVGALTTELGTFTNLSEESQDAIIKGVAALDKFGISADMTAKNIGIMTAAMGVSEEQAVNLQAGLFNMALDNDISTQKMMNDFAATADSLAVFGDQAVDVFADLAMAAKQSNMEVSDLLGIAAKFDTFDSATEAVGRLNALLGGPFLNSLEMVMVTDPTERISMLSDALNETGRSFQDMSYFERRAIADAAGLSSVADLAKVMQGNFDGLGGNIGKSADELERLDSIRGSFTTLVDELKSLAMEFAQPFLEPLVKGFKQVVQFVKQIPEPMKKALVAAGAAAVAFKIFKGFTSDMGEEAEKAAGEQDGLTKALSNITGALGKAVAILVVGIPAFKALEPIFESLASAFKGFGGLGDTFAGIQNLGAADFAKTAVGLRAISSAVNEIDPEKAVVISTVFDSAATSMATQTINAGASSAIAQTAAATAMGPTNANITVESVIQMDGREFGRAVKSFDTALGVADATTSV